MSRFKACFGHLCDQEVKHFFDDQRDNELKKSTKRRLRSPTAGGRKFVIMSLKIVLQRDVNSCIFLDSKRYA